MTDLTAEPHLLADRYQPHTLLGRGESAQAYLASDTWAPSREVVLKIQLPETSSSAIHLRQEYGLLAGLSHPHLVEVFEVFKFSLGPSSEDSRLCLVESVAPGRPLSQWSNQASPAELATVAAQVAAALSALAQHGIRHGDVKPENILVAQTEHGPHATLIDFGLATRSSQVGNRGGTPRFMAPEALNGRATSSSDTYSLAVTLAQCLGESLPSGLGQRVTSGRFTHELKAMSHPDPVKRPSAAEVFELFVVHAAEKSQDKLQALQDTGIAGRPIGQENLLKTISAQLERAKVSGCGLNLKGESGCGKTSLAQSAAAAAILLGFQVPGGVQSASSGELTKLRERLGLFEESDALERAQDPTALKWQHFSKLAERIEQRTSNQPIAMIFDDVPPDSPLNEFFAFLNRRGFPRGFCWIQTQALRTQRSQAAPFAR